MQVKYRFLRCIKEQKKSKLSYKLLKEILEKTL
jgi:hypothetical protein